MSLQKIHLRKLLQIFYASNAKRTSLLRDDIRSEIRKTAGLDAGGGDFHVPFWSDAKNHASGQADLILLTKTRIAANEGRSRLYPLLQDAFLTWWNEKRRWRNEDFVVMPEPVKARLQIAELDSVVKVENLLAVRIGERTDRLVYPYFCEAPPLSEEAARLGLWALHEALKAYSIDDFRILDILRSRSFSTSDVPMQGNERALFAAKYKAALADWERLKKEYE
jgi:hypothetical protein